MQHAQQQTASRQRSGWTEEENQLLWKSVAQSREMGLPLKNAFDRMAALTGRKANSIRNYYYSQVKENDAIQIGEKTAFTPFTQEEIERLVKTVLRAQAEGKSVRRITMEMGNGDKKAMLRYQNKYRSIVKSNPELIRRIITQMRANGERVFDPYSEERPHKSGRKPNERHIQDMDEALTELGENLKRIRGVDACNLVRQLSQLVNLAVKEK